MRVRDECLCACCEWSNFVRTVLFASRNSSDQVIKFLLFLLLQEIARDSEFAEFCFRQLRVFVNDDISGEFW